MPKPVLLWTDLLIWLLVLISLLFAWYTVRHEHLRAPWRRVARSRTAMSALMVLAVYILVGLVDSIHFNPRLANAGNQQQQHSSSVVSLLDIVAEPLRLRRETTYSAPLATHAYVKESIDIADGGSVRTYPRLKYGGAHLDDPSAQWFADIIKLGVYGALGGASIWCLLVAAFSMLAARRATVSWQRCAKDLLSGTKEVSWHAALWTLLILLALIGSCLAVSSQYHVLGTDKVGQDVFYQAVKSIRTGLVIGTLTTLVMLPAAVLLGVMAGYFKGWVDDVIQYLYTTLNSIPSVLLIAAAVLMMHIYMSNHADEFNSVIERADLRLLFLCGILGVTSWTGLCRLLRGETFKLRELEYVQSAYAQGVGHFTILYRHIVPNVLHIVLITVVLDFSGLVLAEAVLSYINIGVDPSTDSWGNMINSARLELAREPVVWWSLAAAFFFMFTLVLAANLFADAVRDAFDPRLRSIR